MQFWNDLSTPVKGVVIIGALMLVYLGIAKATGSLPPFHEEAGIQQSRGVGSH